MKRIDKIILLLSFLLWGCFEDKGNYDYIEREKITITGIDAGYIRQFEEERLTIRPQVTSSIPGAEFVYNWSIDNGDTLTQTLMLDTLADWDPNKIYRLRFTAKNKTTGLSAFKQVEFIIKTPFSVGWYVLKDNGTYTDIDLYSEKDHIKMENIIQYKNGKQLKGKAAKFWYFFNYDIFNEEANKYEETKTLFAMTDQEMMGIDVSQAKILKTNEELFFEQPEKIALQYMSANASSKMLINNGLLYTHSNQSATNGRFGIAKSGHEDNDYFLSKYGYSDYMQTDFLVFDTISSSFFVTNINKGFLMPLKNKEGAGMSCNNNNKRLLYLGNKEVYYGTTAYAVMQDKTNANLKMISRIDVSGLKNKQLSISNDTLKTSDNALRGEFFSISLTEEVLYFVTDDILWARNVADKAGKEIKQFTIPAGEKTTFIRSVKYAEKNGVNLNYVMLGTTDGTNYKIRFFAKTSAGNLNPEPAFTLPKTGTAAGRAGDIIYISPKLSPFYLYSY